MNKNKRKRLLLFDLDDTLLRNDKTSQNGHWMHFANAENRVF